MALLCLVVLASGWLHLAGASHAAAPAQAAASVVGVDHSAGAPCDEHAAGHDLGEGCPIAAGCSFCVPLPQFVLFEADAGVHAAAAADSRFVGTIVTPGLHPPRRSTRA